MFEWTFPTGSPINDTTSEGVEMIGTASDEDGVYDADDLCPYTSTLDVADSTGCGAAQRDTDDDGVMDADDLCPMTQPGYNADMNGCDSTQLDGDGDGVIDENGCMGHERFFTGPYSRYVIANVGHNLPQEAPEEFSKVILSLLKSTSR